jgi:hypothetical protein
MTVTMSDLTELAKLLGALTGLAREAMKWIASARRKPAVD